MRRYLLLTAVLGIALSISDGRAQDFHGIPCEGGDCSSSEAGYRWAQQKDITRETQCQQSPEALYGGCLAWAREHSLCCTL
jgi:hypothetical protein